VTGMMGSDGPSPGPASCREGAVLNWRQWVSPEARAEILRFMWIAFAVGVVAAAIAAWIYASWSESKDWVFHCAIILAACGFTMPAFATSIRIMLVMFYMNWHASMAQQGMISDLKEVKDEAVPILDDLGKVVSTLKTVADRYAKDDVVKSAILEVERLAERLIDGKNGILPRFERKIDDVVAALGAPMGPRQAGLLEKGIAGPGNGVGKEILGMNGMAEGRPNGALQVHEGTPEGHELPEGRQGQAPPDALLSEEAPVGAARAGGRGGAPRRVPAGP